MSLFRTLIAVVAAMGLSSAVAFAADDASTNATSATETQQPMQVANTSSSSTEATTSTTQEKVNVNQATAKELTKVEGFNNSKAKAVVTYRKKHGDFKSIDDLKQVKALKRLNDTQWQKIQDQITFG